jgi:hypothetical protein
MCIYYVPDELSSIYLFIIFEANQEQMTFEGLSEGML